MGVKGRRSNKERLYELFAQVARSIANPHRLELLDLLVQAPRTVQALAREAHIKIGNASQHLQRLKHAGLVADERRGTGVVYRIADRSVARLFIALRDAARNRLAEVEAALSAYRERRHEFTRITAQELVVRLRKGEVTLLDVRPGVEYKAGHLPGARSVPLDELEAAMDSLPRNNTVVGYCRGPYCVFADDALALLAEKGFRVSRLDEGVAEWQMAGRALA